MALSGGGRMRPPFLSSPSRVSMVSMLGFAVGATAGAACTRKEASPSLDAASFASASASASGIEPVPPPIAPHAIARPKEAVCELAVLTSAPRAELEGLVAPANRAKLVNRDKLCGEQATCAAVRA